MCEHFVTSIQNLYNFKHHSRYLPQYANSLRTISNANTSYCDIQGQLHFIASLKQWVGGFTDSIYIKEQVLTLDIYLKTLLYKSCTVSEGNSSGKSRFGFLICLLLSLRAGVTFAATMSLALGLGSKTGSYTDEATIGVVVSAFRFTPFLV